MMAKKKVTKKKVKKQKGQSQSPLGIKNVLALLGCMALFLLGFVLNGNLGLYFNMSALLIVIAGTLGSTLICFRLERLKIVWLVLKFSYKSKVKNPDEFIEALIDLSVKSKLQGALSLQEDEGEASSIFLRRGLGYVVDGIPPAQVRDLLNTEMYFFKMRREESERVLRIMAEVAPSFGLIGSVVGLIAMLAGVGDTSVIIATVPIALTSTLYGVLLSNFFLLPFATQISERTDQELLLQKFIMEGVISIASEHHPRMLEKKLKAFLTPSARRGELVSFKKIQEKLNARSAASSAEPEQKKRTLAK